MRFSLKEDWQDKMIVKIKIYSLDTNDRKMINDTFNRLQTQNKLKFTIAATSFAYSVFVIWTIKDDVRKNKIIVNIRDLNALLISDAYLVSSQSEIINDLFECKYLSMLDVNVFFLSMKSSFEWRLQTNSDDTSRTENLFSSYHEKSKFDRIRSTTDEYSTQQSQKVRKNVYWRYHLQIENVSRILETFKNFISNFSSKRNHYKFVEDFSRLSERDIIKTANECFWINHRREKIESDCAF
jgi:hypothetical protein